MASSLTRVIREVDARAIWCRRHAGLQVSWSGLVHGPAPLVITGGLHMLTSFATATGTRPVSRLAA